MAVRIKKTSSNFICFVTCPNIKTARLIASAVVKDGFAACVNVVKGIESIYKWKDKICKDSEVLLIIKGHFRNQKKLAKKIQSLHSYDVPEIIFFKLDSGFNKYIDWLNANS